MNLIEALTNPDTFFKNSLKKKSLKEPFLIVLIFSILIAISAYISTSIIYKIFPPQYQQVLAFTKIIALISTFIGGIVAWLIIAGFMHLISMIFKGEGSFKKTLSFTGYGFLPNILSFNNNTYCLLYARNLTTRNAFITALIPTVIFGLYQLYSVLKLL